MLAVLLLIAFAAPAAFADETASSLALSNRPGLNFAVAAGTGQVNSEVSRSLSEGLSFRPGATGFFELSLGTADASRRRVDFARIAYWAPGRVRAEFNAFGSTSSPDTCDFDGCSLARSMPFGFELLPTYGRVLVDRGRGYFMYRPTVALQANVFALRAAPMAGYGYGRRANDDSLARVAFAGFNIGLDGRLSSRWFELGGALRVQAGASLDLYQDLTGHLGQVSVDGRMNDDTMTGLAFAEVVTRLGRSDELAFGWKGTYDRLTPFDRAAGKAARNEDTSIGIYLRWSGSPNLGSPALSHGG